MTEKQTSIVFNPSGGFWLVLALVWFCGIAAGFCAGFALGVWMR